MSGSQGRQNLTLSTDFGAAANNINVRRHELAKPPSNSGQTNAEKVFQTDEFEVRGVCREQTFGPDPETRISMPIGELLLVAKQPTSTNTVSFEDSTTPSEHFLLEFGDAVQIAGTSRFATSLDAAITYGSYIADAPSGFPEGHGSVSFDLSPSDPGDTCRLSATGLGQ
jgi:hypothetical protein